jgi:hypothetical protein
MTRALLQLRYKGWGDALVVSSSTDQSNDCYTLFQSQPSVYLSTYCTLLAIVRNVVPIT